MRLCKKCNQMKEEYDFYNRYGRCKNCKRADVYVYRQKNLEKVLERKRKYAKSPRGRAVRYNSREKCLSRIENRFIQWKTSAEKRGIEWNLNLEYVKSLPMICFYTGDDLVLGQNKPNTISLDRIDSSKGYSEENVVFCCANVNRFKASISLDDFVNMCKKIAAHRG
jgi:hypothetical protein